MSKELTRNGVVGLELTREEVIDLSYRVRALMRKAQCREVNCDIIDMVDDVRSQLEAIDYEITKILGKE